MPLVRVTTFRKVSPGLPSASHRTGLMPSENPERALDVKERIIRQGTSKIKRPILLLTEFPPILA